MKKMLLIVPVLFLLAAACDRATIQPTVDQSQQTSPSNAETVRSDWKIYTDNKLGFRFMYPGDWTVSTQVPDLFTFTTRQGYTAHLGVDVFEPYIFDGARKYAIEDTGRSRTVVIGTENGLEDNGIVCNPGEKDSCTASFEFISNQLTTKGFSFYVHVGIKDSDVLSDNITRDPYLIVTPEVMQVEKVLSTFKFIN